MLVPAGFTGGDRRDKVKRAPLEKGLPFAGDRPASLSVRERPLA